MLLLIITAAFVGLIHSLSPAHWLPIVLVTRAKRWGPRQAFTGALVASAGHILVSIIVAALVIGFGAQVVETDEERIEGVAGLLLALFGICYAAWFWYRHRSCETHAHHGPVFKKSMNPFGFLFLVGFSPCVAVVPVLAAAAAYGLVPLVAAGLGFTFGVVTALGLATTIVSKGLLKLDHPILEHYADVIAGVCISLVGVALFIF